MCEHRLTSLDQFLTYSDGVRMTDPTSALDKRNKFISTNLQAKPGRLRYRCHRSALRICLQRLHDAYWSNQPVERFTLRQQSPEDSDTLQRLSYTQKDEL